MFHCSVINVLFVVVSFLFIRCNFYILAHLFKFVNNFFIYFFVAFYLSAFSVKAYLLYPILFDLSRAFSISFSFLTDCLAGISRNSYWVYHQQSVLSTPFFTFLQKILTVVKVLFFSRIPPHSCCECTSCICMTYFFCAPLHLHSIPVGAKPLSTGQCANVRPAGGCIRWGIGSHHWYWLASRHP